MAHTAVGAMRRCLLLLAAAASAGLAACDDPEPAQRRAFLDLLRAQAEAVHPARPLGLPADQRAALGRYAAHWDVLTDFDRTVAASVVGPFRATMRLAAVRSPGDAAARRAALLAGRDAVAGMASALEAALAGAEAARAALPRQPDEVAALYCAAYARLVTAPAALLRAALPLLAGGLEAGAGLGGQVEREAGRGRLRVMGDMVEARDPVLRTELEAQMRALRAREAALGEVARRVEEVWGS